MPKASSVFFSLFILSLVVTIICIVFSVFTFFLIWTLTYNPESLGELIVFFAIYLSIFGLGFLGLSFWITLSIIFGIITIIFMILWLVFRRRGKVESAKFNF